jgi:GNAT superfamily N-acetyltransferase
MDVPEASPSLPDGLSFQVWTPTLRHPFPPVLGWMHGVAALLQLSGVMPNLGYSVVYVHRGARIIHHSCTFSRCYRWMFVGQSEVQISSTWTDPEFRNQGIASATLAYIMHTVATGCHRYWYICREDNEASRRTCIHAGFEFAFHVKRNSLCGILGTRWYSVKDREQRSRQDEGWIPAVSVERQNWFGKYCVRKAADRNDLR